jgi:hypothetical protein
VAEAAKHRRRISIAERAGVGYDVLNMEISNLQISGIALHQGHAGDEQDTQGEHLGNARKILSPARGENEEQPSVPRGGAQPATIGAAIRSPAFDVSVSLENSPAAERNDAQNLFTTMTHVGARVSALWTPTLETEAGEDSDDIDKYEEYFEENGETEQIDCKADKESHTGAGRSPQGKQKEERADSEVEAQVQVVPRDVSLEFSNSPLLLSPILPPSQTRARAKVMGRKMRMGCSAASAATLDTLSVSSSFCDHKSEMQLEMSTSGHSFSFLQEEAP